MQTQKLSSERNWQEEKVLVVKREYLFKDDALQGLGKVDFDAYLKIIKEKKEFLPRGKMETDPNYKQIIPYLIFVHEEKFFLMQRKSKASEARLQNKFTLGIGGHIREEDLNSDSIVDWAKREFHEEVNYSGNLEIEPMGLLNDDSNDVGKVHLGFVFLLKGDSAKISVKSELESGKLATLEECKMHEAQMETWSQLVFQFIEETL